MNSTLSPKPERSETFREDTKHIPVKGSSTVWTIGHVDTGMGWFNAVNTHRICHGTY